MAKLAIYLHVGVVWAFLIVGRISVRRYSILIYLQHVAQYSRSSLMFIRSQFLLGKVQDGGYFGIRNVVALEMAIHHDPAQTFNITQ